MPQFGLRARRMERWEGTRRLACSCIAALSLALVSACGRFGFESLPDLGVGGSGVLNNGGDASATAAGTGGGGSDAGGGSGTGGQGPQTCSVGTLADCSACGDDCSTQSMPGVAELACVSAICTIGNCAPGYDDCDNDPSNGCETALNTLTDCGTCNQPCAILNAEASCGSGTCQLVECTPGFGDCDTDLATNGCERELDTLTNCGGCGVPCALDNATPSCDTGSCQLVTCANGFDNCDGNIATGCETPLDSLTDCGSCLTPCSPGGATPSCAGGSCSAASCLANFADCDGDDVSCETSLLTLTDCVSCGVPCGDGSGRLANATASCATGSCGVGSCDSGFDDCDTSPGNGCETRLNTLLDCGGCDVSCSRANATASCTSGSCSTVSCSPGFDDCDGNDSTGCEAQLGSDAHCSACNAACAVNEGCLSGTCVGQFTTFQPANVTLGTLNPGAAPNLVLDCGTITLNTTSPAGNPSTWCGRPRPSLVVQTPSNLPELLVVPLRSLNIAPGSTLRVTGGRPVVLVVFGDVNIAGTIDVSANGSTGGPGQNWNCDLPGGSSDSNGINGGDTSSNGGQNGGGGGGAFRAAGGRGGNGGGQQGGEGGVARGSDLLSPLIPGCNGGWGGGCGAAPGGGGGALQLAASGRIDVTGSLLARGGNGVNGCDSSGGATGGGSGGGILVEGDQVFITGGTLLADGGRGGNGANGGSGGLGSATGAGEVGNASGLSGGGGGGSAGRIRIKGARGCTLGGTVTPAASTGCP